MKFEGKTPLVSNFDITHYKLYLDLNNVLISEEERIEVIKSVEKRQNRQTFSEFIHDGDFKTIYGEIEIKYHKNDENIEGKDIKLNASFENIYIIMVNQEGRSLEFDHDMDSNVLSIDAQNIKNESTIAIKFLTRNRHESCGIQFTDQYCFTLFEPEFASTCFPCRELPYRAFFQLTLLIPEGSDVINNMPKVEKTLQKEREIPWERKLRMIDEDDCIFLSSQEGKIVEFQETEMAINSYLFTFLCGNLHHTKFNNIQFTIPKSLYDDETIQSMHILNSTFIEALKTCTTLFETKLQLKQLHIAFIPNFSLFAMENYGCLFFSYLTLIHHRSPYFWKRRVRRLIFHEIAHQWLGNIVSLPNWKSIWMKEGVVRYIEFDLVYHHNTWNYDQFVTQCIIPALEFDIMDSSHPIHPSQDDNVYFDMIVYEKAAIIFHWLVQTQFGLPITVENEKVIEQWPFSEPQKIDYNLFTKRYVKPNAFRSSNDIVEVFYGFCSMEENQEKFNLHFNENLKWMISEPHFHLLLVRKCDDHYSIEKKMIRKSGKHFDITDSEHFLPILLKDSSENLYRARLRNVKTNFEFNELPFVNAHSIGFCRVHYSESGYVELLKQYSFDDSEMISLLSDVFFFASFPSKNPLSLSINWLIGIFKPLLMQNEAMKRYHPTRFLLQQSIKLSYRYSAVYPTFQSFMLRGFPREMIEEASEEVAQMHVLIQRHLNLAKFTKVLPNPLSY
mmetsp:Transcript_14037/g.21250  ORF Transcript_14037/g.21250 Transcript_14037/m.21250 type:complete len:729 (-) Transcript_14037:1040-3226(-)